MKVGFVGLGKLGLPCAVAMAMKGHNVIGYDINPDNMNTNPRPYKETGPDGVEEFNPYLEESTIQFGSLQEVADHSEIVFVAIQTPHSEKFEGVTRLPNERVDFDYTWLKIGIENLANVVKKDTVIAVISTVLPGTIRREIIPLLNKNMKLVYTPQFIAMGTTMRDFLQNEFWLFGVNDEWAAEKGIEFFQTISDAPIARCTIEEAEAIKVLYNCAISTKIAQVNTWMEMAHKLPNVNVDTITDTLALATRRVNSFAYMRGGMGDGGSCLKSNTYVYTSNGAKHIQDIQVGEKILSGDGKLQPVLKTYTREVDETIYKLSVRGLPSIDITGNHEVFVAKDLRPTYETMSRNKIVTKRMTHKPIEDSLGSVEKISVQDLYESAEEYYIVFPTVKGNLNLPPYATLEYVELAGYYLAEGWYEEKYKRLNFSFHKEEKTHHERVKALYSSLSDDTHIYEYIRPNSCSYSLRFNGAQTLGNTLVNDFGSFSHLKRFPEWILFGNDLEKIKCILRGLFRGDGCSTREGFSLSTTSANLAHGTKLLLNRLGITCTVQYYNKRPRPNDGIVRKECWEVRVRNAAFIESLSDILGMDVHHPLQEKRYPNSIPFLNNCHYHRITDIVPYHYTGSVHNLNVDGEHTYVCDTGKISNCHPRDNIALSWLSRKLDLSYDWFEAVMLAREKQAQWLCEILSSYYWRRDAHYDKVLLLGYSFKPESNITVGSPALLCENILEEMGVPVIKYDPFVDEHRFAWAGSARGDLILIGTKHEVFKQWRFPRGSVVMDPFRYIEDQEGVEVIRIGE